MTEDWKSQLFLTKQQTAEVLGVPVDTVVNLIRTKQLPRVLVGKHCRICPESIIRYRDRLLESSKCDG